MKTFTGQVVSDKMTNTIVISLEYKYRHPLYKKILKKHKKIYSENNLGAKVGDTVKVREVRPLSRLKRFTIINIVKSSSPQL
ncbi:MAG: 30S ribosomal protein S17 [Candidatus Shapirobacteria bacterium]|jgi:small subunit ribosomal protein S17